MTSLVWDKPDQRRYETGVDRGVLYPEDGPGVVWNGLAGVEESSVGGDSNAYHFDGRKYLDVASPKNFQAKITAFSAPQQFSPAIGERSIIPGFVLTRQPRGRFGVSYRTLIGDGIGYKIHLVYNALASPDGRSYSSVDGAGGVEPITWTIDATPPGAETFRPSAHFVIDSTKVDPNSLNAIETLLYGNGLITPHLPSIDELMDIVGTWDPLLILPETGTGLSRLVPEARDIYSQTYSGVDFTPNPSWTTSHDNPDGSWTGTLLTTADVQLTGPIISVSAIEQRRYIHVRMAVDGGTGPVTLYYAVNGGGMVGGQAILFEPIRDGEMHDYVLEPATMSYAGASTWLDPTKSITQLRLDPIQVISSLTTVILESISVGGSVVEVVETNYIYNPSFEGLASTVVAVRINLLPNPLAISTGTSGAWNSFAGSGGTVTNSFQTGQSGWAGGMTTSYRATWTVDSTLITGGVYIGQTNSTMLPVTPGSTYGAFMQFRCSKAQRIVGTIIFYDATNTQVGTAIGSTVVTTANVINSVRANGIAPAGATHAVFTAYATGGASGVIWNAGDWMEGTRGHFEETDVILQNALTSRPLSGTFWGNVGNPGGVDVGEGILADYTFAFSGTVNASTSEMRGVVPNGWAVAGSAPGHSLTLSTDRAFFGTHSARLSGGTGANNTNRAQILVGGRDDLVIGQTYTFYAMVWVPTGAPHVVAVGTTSGPIITDKDAWVVAYQTFVATSTTMQPYIYQYNNVVNGNDLCYIDGAMLVDGVPDFASFSGDSPAGLYDPKYTYAWKGLSNFSASVKRQYVDLAALGAGDLYRTKVDGILRALPSTRLNQSPIGGLYRLEL